jgi:hypothetical protein
MMLRQHIDSWYSLFPGVLDRGEHAQARNPARAIAKKLFITILFDDQGLT